MQLPSKDPRHPVGTLALTAAAGSQKLFSITILLTLFRLNMDISCTTVVTIHQVPMNSPLQIGSEQQTYISRRLRAISLIITGW